MATYSIAALALAAACSAAAAAPTPSVWPTRPIRLVVPAVPGGAIDVSSRVTSAVTGLSPVLPQAHAKKVRILAATTAARSAFVPTVPTLSESGLSGFDVYEWIVLLAPAGAPGGIVKRLNDEVAKILIGPAVRERFAAASLDPRPGAPADVRALIREGGAQWGKLIKGLGLKLEH